MAGLVQLQAFESLAIRGERVGLGGAIHAGFDIARPRVGFAPARRLEREIWEPFAKWLPSVLPAADSIGLQQDASGRPITDPAQLEGQGNVISADLADRLRNQEDQPDEQTFVDLLAELDVMGISIPDSITPEAMALRREDITAGYLADLQRNEEILSRAGQKTGLLGQFIGGFGAELTDPANVATFVIGAPARFGILATALTEAGVNSLIEGAQTPGRNEFLRAIGAPEETLLRNMGFGALFGGIFGGTMKTAQVTIRNASQSVAARIKSNQARREVVRLGRESEDPDIRAAAEVVSRDLDDEAAAITNPSIEASREHNARAQEATQAAHEGRAPDMPDRPTAATPARSIINGEIEEVIPGNLLVQPDRFQFKSEIVAEGGVTPKLQDVTKWDPGMAGVVMVFEYADGSRAIADGHQRVALANRIMEADPKQDILLAAKVFREADGFTVPEIREVAALINIAQAADGMTSAMARDAAKILRVNPAAIETLPHGPGIARATEWSSLSDDAFNLMINDVVPENIAALVGRMVRDPELHLSIMRLLESTEPRTAAQAESIISQALEAPTIREKVSDLFGEREVVESLYIERAKVLERTMALIRNDRSVFRTLDESAGRIEGRGKNKLDRLSNKEARLQIEQSLAAIQALAHRAGPISEALNNAATKYKETGKLKDAATSVVDAVRGAIEQGGLDSLGNGGVRSTAKAEISRSTAPNPVERFDDPVGEGAKQQVEDTRIDVPAVTKEQQDLGDLRALVDSGADRAVLDNHPAVVKALEEINSRPVTSEQEGYNSLEWHESRSYIIDGVEVKGTWQALEGWTDNAKRLAWKELDLPVQEVKANKELTIVLGPPAAGKSTIANEIAVANRAAIIDVDEIKNTIPEYDEGIGANAVHQESSDLSGLLEENIFAQGLNAVFPKTGKNVDSIAATIARAKEAGYSVRLVNMAVTKENAYSRMISRFISKGRIIPPWLIDDIGEKPSATFRTVKEKGLADGYAEIDGNGGRGEPLQVTERQGTDPIGKTRLTLVESGGPDLQAKPGTQADPRQSGGRTQSEVTPEGQQFLIEGVPPILPVDRLAAAQAAPLRGGDAPAGGLFDEVARAQQDMFDEVPVGVRKDETGMDVPETMTRSEVAAMLDAEDEFLDQLEVCL